LPETQRAVVASVGGIPNAFYRSPTLIPYILAGLPFPQKLLEAHVLTEVVKPGLEMEAALRWADRICSASPDAVQVTKEQVNLIKDGLGIDEVVRRSLEQPESIATYSGANLKEGLRAFNEVRPR
jgi:enoyl-CoA hydratase/carnithine racemase